MSHQVPAFETQEFAPKRSSVALLVTVLNEGDRIQRQLKELQPYLDQVDLVLSDGRSTDGSLHPNILKSINLRACLTTDAPGLSTATRVGLKYILDQGYESVITMDGNSKDGVEAIPAFLTALREGYDLVQGSRFMKGGAHANTPWDRYLVIRYVVSPLVSVKGRHFFSDPTNAFRAMSIRFLNDNRLQIFREIFVAFNLQIYFLCRAAPLGYRVKQIPVRRIYPQGGSVPTKISSWRIKWRYIYELLLTVFGAYHPRPLKRPKTTQKIIPEKKHECSEEQNQAAAL